MIELVLGRIFSLSVIVVIVFINVFQLYGANSIMSSDGVDAEKENQTVCLSIDSIYLF